MKRFFRFSFAVLFYIILAGPLFSKNISMVEVRGETFTMGDRNNGTVRTVTVSNFSIATYETTNREFCAFLNSQGNQTEDRLKWIDIKKDKYCGITARSPISGPFSVKPGYENRPVVYVSWYAAVAYCNWLSERQGLTKCYGDKSSRGTPEQWRNWWYGYMGHQKRTGYRLPTEAEWEYACRAGSETLYFWGDTMNPSYCKFLGNSGGRPHDVGSTKPNKSGIYDMSGNVWEWCSDCWCIDYGPPDEVNPTGPAEGIFRLKRGGTFSSIAEFCSAACRFCETPNKRNNNMGFRLVKNDGSGGAPTGNTTPVNQR
ncbi:MAG: SUMF1/EgtB/PvdO family nonheme iron enzyme [Candidatus Eremiobacteraeota bacterium]|nr:SUMF1/EgtB/PvdO family nonheme iron enzyme [Candidatus Eremiobacteraeota bacterium]